MQDEIRLEIAGVNLAREHGQAGGLGMRGVEAEGALEQIGEPVAIEVAQRAVNAGVVEEIEALRRFPRVGESVVIDHAHFERCAHLAGGDRGRWRNGEFRGAARSDDHLHLTGGRPIARDGRGE